MHDVTKTKASHHGKLNKVEVVEKVKWPVTHEGSLLAGEVRDSTVGTVESKARLVQEIIDYEGSHGACTQTFTKKIRKQIRSRP